MNEINYDAGRKQSTYAQHDLGLRSLPFLASVDTAVAITQRYRLAHKLFDELVGLHQQRLAAINSTGIGEGAIGTPSLCHQYHLHAESWTFQIRRTLDSLVQYVDMLRVPSGTTPTIEYDSIGRLLHPRTDTTSDVYKVIVGDGNTFASDPTDYLNIVNDLFNSMKHCAAHEEAMRLYSADPNVPSVVSYYAKYNNFGNGAAYLNHNAFHLMMGYQDNVCRILENLKQWISLTKPDVAANMVFTQGRGFVTGELFGLPNRSLR